MHRLRKGKEVMYHIIIGQGACNHIDLYLATMTNVLNLITILNQPQNTDLEISIFYEKEKQ